jgi:hypothetical protein
MTGRRWLSAALALGAALVLPAVAGAQIPTQDSLTGSGPLFSVAITSGPSGENPTGSFTADAFGTHFQTTSISCLAVSGNVATFAAPVAPNGLGVTFIKLTVVDNGSGPFIDTFATTGATSPLDCVSPLLGGDLIAGDVVVVDAPPLPSTKKQCKHGGWRGYGVFKNQGDCVSFVATGGKNPAAGT